MSSDLAATVFQGLADADVILCALLVENGVRFRPVDPVKDAGDAVTVDRLFAGLVRDEMRRRELDVQRYATRLMEITLNRLPKDV